MYIEAYQVKKIKTLAFAAGFVMGVCMTYAYQSGSVSALKTSAVDSAISADLWKSKYNNECDR